MSKIVPIPEGLQIDETPGQLKITLPWFQATAWFLVFFCVFWNGFLVFWMLAPTPIFFKAFALIHVAVGVSLTWYTISLFLNTTTLVLDPQMVSIQSGPLWVPGYGAVNLNRHEVKQVYVRQEISNSGKGGTRISYQLYVLDSQARSKKLPISSSDSAQMIFIEHKIEQYFNIQPQEVAGAYPS
jgi:hypothetical protein